MARLIMFCITIVTVGAIDLVRLNQEELPQHPETKDEENKKEFNDLSYRQLEEFQQLGKFQLGQIRSQLDYKTFINNYDLNIDFQLRKVGIWQSDTGSSNSSTSKCYPDLGCIEITEKWYDMTRPLNLLPLDREVVNTQFILYTRENVSHYLEISNKTDIIAAGFDPSRPTKFIIHGFIDNGFETWVKDMTSALLSDSDVNVIVVDWGGGSLPLYSQAAANTRLVGLEVGNMINHLVEDMGADPSQVHIIGHSLGSHIAGYAGEKVEGLGRISGLDPAEPLFQDMPSFVRLDPSDAMFVDVIHTDTKSILMGGYGMKEYVGHVDFYPNGGDVQPGCSLLELPSLLSLTVEDISLPDYATVGRHLVACAHSRAIYLYIDSIRNSRSCPMVGHKCGSYSELQTGDCYHCGYRDRNCALMGYLAEYNENWSDGPVAMYLTTGSVSPYCSHSYLLEIVLASPRESETWVQGQLKANLYGDLGEVTEYVLTPDDESQKFYHGETYTFPLTLEKDLGRVNIIHLYWQYDHDINPFNLEKTCVIFCSDSLYTWAIKISRVGRQDKGSDSVAEETSTLCGDETIGLGYTNVESDTWKLFYNQC